MKTIFFYGDSNTYGYDPRGFGGGRYSTEICWTDRLRKALEGEWTVCVDAMNGREIPQNENAMDRVLHLMESVREEQGLDVMAVMLGTNDLFSAAGPMAAYIVAEKMERFLDRLMAGMPDIRYLLLAPPQLEIREFFIPEERFLPQAAGRLGLLYHVIAESRGQLFANTADWELSLAYDGVHLSEEGHLRFAECMQKEMTDWQAEERDSRQSF